MCETMKSYLLQNMNFILSVTEHKSHILIEIFRLYT